ncbi:MAG: HD domain-containing protein [Desulfohalobiaceae bacterium]
MNDLFQTLKIEAREMASRYRPSFYDHFGPELSYSREIFFDHPLLLRCAEDVLPFLHDEFGHGVEHSKNVSIESGAIILAELYHKDLALGRHLVLLVQMAGLLHDICRLEDNHAMMGAELAPKILQDFPLSETDKEMIIFAIKNHEAFQSPDPAPDFSTHLLSSALYDADKFRWGPDNFTTTLWKICDYQEWPLEKIVERFPRGLQIISSIGDSFRTSTGQIYGPEFIQCGLQVGNYIYRRIKQLSV